MGAAKKSALARGKFISFEGGDGVGKSTQIARLGGFMRTAGHTVVTTREPGGSSGAEAIRTLLVTGDKDRWSSMTEALLMYAARADHLEKTIRPALNSGAVVISDRFADSTMAYQGLAGELGQERVDVLSNLVVGNFQPHLTLILDSPIERALARATQRGGEVRFEEKGSKYQQAVRRAFLTIAADNPTRCVVVDASRSIEEVEHDVLAAVKQRIPELFK